MDQDLTVRDVLLTFDDAQKRLLNQLTFCKTWVTNISESERAELNRVLNTLSETQKLVLYFCVDKGYRWGDIIG